MPSSGIQKYAGARSRLGGKAIAIVVSVVDSNGRFALLLDPGPNREYRFFVEPLLTRSLPRTSLGKMAAPTADVTLDPHALSEGRTISGDGSQRSLPPVKK